MLLKFSRLVKVIGEDDFSILNKSKVLVLGCGGVGGYVVEALARSGIGTLVIVDFDNIDESNINRQIIALDSTVGLKKVDVLEKRIKDINRDCNVIKIDKFITIDNLDELFNCDIDFFVDACDTTSVKKEIIKKCLNKKVKFISCMGTGNKLDPSKLEIIDIAKKIDTYDISILPFEDCCTVFVPKHPVINPKLNLCYEYVRNNFHTIKRNIQCRLLGVPHSVFT